MANPLLRMQPALEELTVLHCPGRIHDLLETLRPPALNNEDGALDECNPVLCPYLHHLQVAVPLSDPMCPQYLEDMLIKAGYIPHLRAQRDDCPQQEASGSCTTCRD